MAKTKIALLYERLSRDDELNGESFSIQNHLPSLCFYAPHMVPILLSSKRAQKVRFSLYGKPHLLFDL